MRLHSAVRTPDANSIDFTCQPTAGNMSTDAFNCTVISLGNRCTLSVVLVIVNVEMTAACECQIIQWFVGFEFGQEIAFSHSIF